MKSPISRIVLILTILVLTFGCDQVTKSIVRKNVNENQIIRIIGDNLIMTKVENKGAFLSVGDNLPDFLREILLTYVPILVLLLALAYLITNRDQPLIIVIAISFVVGGGFGNIFDRLVHGSVTDFLHMDFYLFRTGIFNAADMCIMTGSFLLLYHYLVNQTLQKKSKEKTIQ